MLRLADLAANVVKAFMSMMKKAKRNSLVDESICFLMGKCPAKRDAFLIIICIKMGCVLKYVNL
jgi:hypothetical protein